MTSKFHSGLLQDLLLMLYDADDHNVIIRVGENQNIKEFRAHSSILKGRSSYFKSAFSSNWVVKKDDIFEFEKPNINSNIFEIILKYIYTGEVDLTMNSGEDNIKLLVASDELLLEELFNHVQDYLIENKPNWIQQNFSFVLQTVFKLSDCKTLHDYCLESICAHPLPFFSSNNFLSLDMNIIYELLKRDDLQIEEIVAWDYLIKWGIEQTPGLKNKVNRKEWSDKDYEDLKNTLNEIIPLIRFSCINSSDFFDKIRPYRPIIPNNIYEEIVSFYFKDSIPKSIALSPRIGICHIKSMVIKPNLSTIILNWIERKYHQTTTRDKNDQKYKFDLLYRGSRDGINSGILKDKCYRQFPCLVLISVHSSPKIFGGYSPIGVYFCNGGKWHYTPDSFIFTFENRGDTEKMKMSRVTYPNYALYEFYDCAFNFGGGCLAMDNDKNLHVKNSGYYQNNFNINASYVIKEVEVFRVVKQ